MENKKGISPLIATVLILGFTVALAAVIMVWGTRFTTNIQEQTEETANTQVICTNDVAFKISNVCRVTTDPAVTNNYKVFIENNGIRDIRSLNVRFYKSNTEVTTKEMFSSSIGKYALDNEETGVLASITELLYVQAIPTITVNGRPVVCTANIQDFGSLEGNDVDDC